MKAAKDLKFAMPDTGFSTISETVDNMSGHLIIHEGWVLKKRRKRMQGMSSLLHNYVLLLIIYD